MLQSCRYIHIVKSTHPTSMIKFFINFFRIWNCCRPDLSTVWSNLELEYTCFESNVCLLVCVFSISSMNVRFFPPLFFGWVGQLRTPSFLVGGGYFIAELWFSFGVGGICFCCCQGVSLLRTHLRAKSFGGDTPCTKCKGLYYPSLY